MAQSSITKMKLPNAMFELNLSSGNQVTIVQWLIIQLIFLTFLFTLLKVFFSLQGNTEQVYVEFTHEELYAFYNQVLGV